MQSAPLAGTATTRCHRRSAYTSGYNPQTPSHLPIHSRFASANRGASSKAARFFRHRRRFASFPSRGRQLAHLHGAVFTGALDAIRKHRRTCRFTTASRLPIGALPRKRLASSATGGASPLSPCGDGNSKIPQHPSFCLDAIRKHRRTCRFPDALRLPIGVFPRKRLAFSATGGASPLSPSGVNTEAVFSASVYFCAKAFLRCPRSPVAQDLSAPPGLYLDPQHLFPAVMDKGKLRFTSPVRQNIHLPCGFPAGDRPQNGAPVSYMQQAA